MRVRHQDRLSVSISVSPRASRALVPHFILQPLVENAIEHGIARRAGAGSIVVDASDVEQRLEIRVADDGGGVLAANNGRAPDEGIGLGNTRLRLSQLYGEAQSLSLKHPDSGGTLVTVTIPLRERDVRMPLPGAEPMLVGQ
jgi:LytS/YehU family sensor histidine kinase